MRLGLLGPALGHDDALERAARAMQAELGADRVVYLGADRALDTLVARWATDLVGADASDEGLLARATRDCVSAPPERIDDFIRRETARSRLRVFESLAGEATRSVELIAGKVAVMLYDKADLEEDDILPATLLLFGKSHAPLVKQVGRRWFLSPGSFPDAGIVVIDDEGDDLFASRYSPDLQLIERTHLEAPRALRMRVGG